MGPTQTNRRIFSPAPNTEVMLKSNGFSGTQGLLNGFLKLDNSYKEQLK